MVNKFCKIWNLVIAAVFITTLVAAVSVQAATVTSANDTPSTLENGVAANHFLFFTTPSGLNEGDTLTIAFASAFDTSTITENEIDFEDDGLDLTTAEDCSGLEEASVEIAADEITITICPGDGGTITSGSEMVVEIGTNAAASGEGVFQIINPADEGNYFIALAGTFGDSGSIVLPIGEDSAVGVSAGVPSHGSPSPSGGCSDYAAPTISEITVSEITTNSASISWSTNEEADGLVEYGLSDAYEVGLKSSTSLVTSRTITLEDLDEGVTYHFRVSSNDRCSNHAISSDYTFDTLDEHAPIISNVEVVDITETSARITWTTNEPSDSLIDYGLSTEYGTVTIDEALETEHSILLTELTEGTTYYFTVSSSDASGNTTEEAGYSFTTLLNEAPANVSDFTAVAGDGWVTLSWVLPSDDDLAGVLVLSCLGDYPTSPTDSTCTEIFDALGTTTIHSGLTNGTTYFYGAFAYDLADQFASGAITSATPQAATEDSCGNGVCESEEDSSTCPSDCPTAPVIPPSDDGDVCGDTVCDASESVFTCPSDCPTTPEIPETPDDDDVVCGDTVCDASESTFTCPSDCPTAPVIPPSDEGAVCGDAVCEGEETYENCPSNCPSSEIPVTTVPDNELIPNTDVSFTASGKTIDLPIVENVIEMVAGSEISAAVLLEHVSKEVANTILSVGSESFILSLNNGAYRADVTVPGTATRHALYVVINYKDGTSQTLSFVADLKEPGLVFENLNEKKTSISGASVTLYYLNNNTWVVWDGSPWKQDNPTETDNNGDFFWYATNGTYKVLVKKDGYEENGTGSIEVINNIINSKIELRRIPQTTTTIVTSVGETISETVNQIIESFNEIKESPLTETTTEIATPVVAVAALASTVILFTAFDLLPFLHLLFTSPILLIKRRKRKGYGVVYDAFTKKPIDLAMVRLYRLSDGKLIRSRVTDKGGRFHFLTQPGEYRIEVTKNGFSFPSQKLLTIKDDTFYLDIYHGENLRVTEKEAIITPNIPIESIDSSKKHSPGEIKRVQFLRKFQKWSASGGLLVSAFVVLMRPRWWSWALLGGQLAVYLLIRRLATPPKPKSWGIVYDRMTGRPLASAVVRIFEPKYQKLLETGITDSHGRYTFLLGPNEYSSTFEKTGYQPREVHPIDYSGNKEISEWSQDIDLIPENKEQKK